MDVTTSDTSVPLDKSKGLECSTESPENKSSTNTLSEKISLCRKSSQVSVSHERLLEADPDKPSTSGLDGSPDSDVDAESEQMTRVRPFRASPDYDRDCDSKAVLTGSLLEFGTASSSEDEEDGSEANPRLKKGMMLGNWIGTKKVLEKKFLKKFGKKKGKASQCPVIRSSDNVNANVFLTEDIDDDLEVLTSLPLDNEYVDPPKILTARPNSKQGTSSPLVNMNKKVVSVIDEPTVEREQQSLGGHNDNCGFNPDEVIDISGRKETRSPKVSVNPRSENDQATKQTQGNTSEHGPVTSKKKTVVSRVQTTSIYDKGKIFTQMPVVETPSAATDALIEKIFVPKEKPTKKQDRIPRTTKQENIPGMYQNSSEDSDSDKEVNYSPSGNRRKLRGGVKLGWLNRSSNRCDSPGTVMRKMKEDGIIPKVKDIDSTREAVRRREMIELEELGIVTGNNGNSGTTVDSIISGLNRRAPPKLAPLDLHKDVFDF